MPDTFQQKYNNDNTNRDGTTRDFEKVEDDFCTLSDTNQHACKQFSLMKTS